MKKIHSIICGLLMTTTLQTVVAAEWSYDWPVSATQDKDTGYANGFYNFSSNYDGTITSMERTFDGKKWTVNFDAGAQLAYTSSGQLIGSAGKGTSYFTLVSDSFDGNILSASIELKTKATDATIAFSVGETAYTMDGETTIAVNGDNELHTYTFIPASGSGTSEGIVCYRFEAPSANTANYVKKITIVYEERVSTIEPPAFSPAPGIFDTPVEVSLSGPEGAEILYTLDGSNPLTEGNAGSHIYSSPIEIAETSTIKAAARLGEESSNIAEGEFVIRKAAGLTIFYAPSEIELLEEGIILLDNPNNVSPITYTSSNPQVASIDQNGHIYTFSLGEVLITAAFAGDDTYLPQTLEIPVSVIAKSPVTGFTVTPEGGSYEGPLTVNIACTDPRVETIWYNVGPVASEVDDLGILEYGQYTIYNGTELTLTLNEDCVLSVQAMGYNLWSEPKFIEYTITTPVQGDVPAAGIGLPGNAYFSPDAGLVVALNKEVTFKDTSEGQPTSWLWSLPGTDLGTSASKDVTVKYTEAGTYDVDLTVTYDSGQSSACVNDVKAGGESFIWNIPTADKDKLTMVDLGWFGVYGGTNWIDMEAFAERFEAPMAPVSISGVNVYFGVVSYDDPDGELSVSLMLPDENGMPSTTLATSTLKYSQLTDASENYNNPTWFEFEPAAEIDSDFFVSVSGFPNSGENDLIAMYSLRREDAKSTSYHLLAEYDDNWEPTGEFNWYKQEDEPVSFAIAPKIEFKDGSVGVSPAKASEYEGELFNLQGIRFGKDTGRTQLEPGIYLQRHAGKTLKIKR